MNKRLKKIFAIIISVIIFFQLLPLSASADNSIAVSESIVNDTCQEERYYCTATIEDNFADNCVLVVIDHANSIVDRVFTADDFPDVDVKEITYLTSPITPLFEESETNEEAQSKAETLALTNVEEFNHIIRIDLNVTGRYKVLEAIKTLEKLDFVLSAEPNYIATVELGTEENELEDSNQEASSAISIASCDNITNDTLVGSQYALETIQVQKAWDITTGSNSIRVGVVDSGYHSHPDLNDNVITGRNFIGIEDDVAESYQNEHGNMVAGIIGAVGNNNKGVAGINWNTKLVPLRIIDEKYSWEYNDLISAINFARENNIPVINCSLESSKYNSDCKEAIENYKGLVVCAAGNDGDNTDKNKCYPAGFDCDNIISVAATKKSDYLRSDSNYGATTVDLGAPGNGVWTTANNGYDKFNQTSCAAPHVAGVAALILSVRPDLSAEQVKACILNGVDKVDALEGKCVTGGRLNAYKALQLALDFPSDQMVSGDFDGNGKDDVAYITDSGYGSMKIYVRKNGVGTPTLWTEEKSFYTANVDDRVTAGDFNGDGKDDIALLYDNKNAKARIHVLLSNGSGFNSRSSWFVQSTEGTYDANRTTGRVTSGDFNGDGKDDVSAMYDYGEGKMRIHMFISTGSSFNWKYWYGDMVGGNFYASGVTGRYEAGDFNGDGKDDIAAMYGYADGRTRVHVWLSNGTSLNQRTAWFIQDTPYYYNTERVNNRFVAGDFNDDGKDDIGTLYEYSGGTMMLHVFVSQSDTFSWWQNWYHSSTEGSFYTDAVTGFNSGDYNGDGNLDIMLRYSYRAGYSKLLQYQSTGSSFNYIAKFLYWETII